MTGFLPENPGVLQMDVIAEIRRRHLVESETISSLAIAFKLSRPTIRKHLKTVEEPAYLRKHQPHPMLGSFHEQLHAWLTHEADLPRKQRRTAQRLYECCKSRVTKAVTRQCSATLRTGRRNDLRIPPSNKHSYP